MTPPTPSSGGSSRRDRTVPPSRWLRPPQAGIVPPSRGDDGWMLAVELVTATLVWGGIGWLLDTWLGTGPWLMCLGFVVGNGAGIYLLWLRTNDALAPAGDEATRGGPDASG